MDPLGVLIVASIFGGMLIYPLGNNLGNSDNQVARAVGYALLGVIISIWVVTVFWLLAEILPPDTCERWVRTYEGRECVD